MTDISPPFETSRPSTLRIWTGERLIVAVLWALAVLWMLASLTFPFGYDHGVFAAIGHLILRGELPYRDVWEVKGPFALYLYALAEWLFGHHEWAPRLLDLIFLAPTAWLVARLAGTTTPRVSLWAAAAYVLFYGSVNYWNTAQPDGWTAALMIAAIAGVVTPGENHRWWLRYLAAGIAVGLCLLLKPFYIAYCGIFWLQLLVRRGRHSRAAWRDAALVPVGVLVAVVPVLGWFAAHGALESFLSVHLGYTAKAYPALAQLAVGERADGLLRYLLRSDVIPFTIPPATLGAIALWRARRDLCAALLAWLALGVGFVVLQNEFFPYQWLPIFPAIGVLTIVGIGTALGAGETSVVGGARPARVLGIAMAALLTMQISSQPLHAVAKWVPFAIGHETRIQYFSGFENVDYVSGDDNGAAERIASTTGPNDRVAVWGWNAAINYLSDRPPASRFLFSFPLINGSGTAIRESYRQEYVRELAQHPPAYFVNGSYKWGMDSTMVDFPALCQFLGSRYTLAERVGGLELYRLRADSGRASAPFDRICPGPTASIAAPVEQSGRSAQR